jgi:flagellar hook-associated protein FlgK
MINSYSGFYTITQGLQVEQLLENITASNLANTSVDSNGYLVGSLQQVNLGSGPSEILSTTNGNIGVSTGPTVESITSLRSSFLDSQIQNESSVLGQAEILSNTQGSGVLNLINNIVNGPSTLNGALTTFAAAWGALATNPNGPAVPATPTTPAIPSSGQLQAAVVQDGEAFAQLANTQYEQLTSLQQNNNSQINNTVSQINQLLQQLSSINHDLLNSQGAANVNSLLDARDYALDQLSRLINIQTNIGVAGTVSVYLSGSSVTLVDPSGAAILQTNVENPNYPELLGVTIQSTEGGYPDAATSTYINASGVKVTTVTPEDMSQWITGGNLGGELQGQNEILSYISKVNQIATSVMNVTNSLQQAGYGQDGATTNTPFFIETGEANDSVSGAALISVNAVLVANNNLVASSLVPNTDPNFGAVNPAFAAQGITYAGTMAEYLSNLPNLLANNFAESYDGIAGAYVDPTQDLSTQPIAVPPTNGEFTVNGVAIYYYVNQATETAAVAGGQPAGPTTIDGIIEAINQADNNVYAVYNASTEQFTLLSNQPISIQNVTGNFVSGASNWSNIANVLTSTIQMNSSNIPVFSQIDFGNLPGDPGNPMNSTVPSAFLPNTGPNSQSFQIVPSPSGTFTLYPPYPNGVQISWTNTMSLSQIATAINTASGGVITASFNTNTQTLTLYDYAPQPMNIVDNTGNFTAFTGLNGNITLGTMTSGLSGQISSNVAGQQVLTEQASNSLTQLNNAQANIAGVATTSGQPGVPIATIEQQATQEMIAYNALLEVLEVMDEMYSDLVGIISSSTPSGSFQNQTTPV